MPERIRVEADLDVHAQVPLAILLSVQPMAHKALSSGNIAVRLDRPRAHHFPSSFPDPLLNLRKHGRISFLNPAVMHGRRVTVAEAGRFLHAIQRAAGRTEDEV